MSKEFVFEKTVYLSDTNALGNVYFAKYFEWMGMAREEFFRQIVPNSTGFFENRGVKLITVNASIEYKSETKLYDQVVIKMRIGNVRKASYDVHFVYENKDSRKLICEGRQTIAFADSSGKLIPIPEELKSVGQEYVDKTLLVMSKILNK